MTNLNNKNSESKLLFSAKKDVLRKPKNIWIIKPGENTNRGNGITVC